MSVTYEVTDRVAHVVIDRPERRNAMDLEVFAGLAEAAGRAGADPEVGAVVVSGRDGHFSSGIDLTVLGKQITGSPGDGSAGEDDPSSNGIDASLIARIQASFTALEELDVPTVAAIEGTCFGAGVQLALACHLRAVAPSATLRVLETRWGLVPDLGGTWRLPRLVGQGRATELMLTTRAVDAGEALTIGFAERRLPDADPLAGAHELAARLAAGPGALRRVPRLVRENLARDRRDALAAEGEAQLACLEGPDVAEAVTAHLEGREPRFVGR